MQQSIQHILQKVSQIFFSYCLSPSSYYIMAFIPPDRPEAHAQMEVEYKEQLHRIKNSIGNKVALLWFNFDAEYTILYSHGNAEDLAGSKSTFIDLANNLGVNLCAYDYSGYGLSEGTCSQKACFSDVDAVYDFLVNKQHIHPSKILLLGRSLGSGPTMYLASEHPNLAGMILQSPLRTAIKTQMPDWVGVVFNKIDIFCNEERVKKITNFPVLIIHGTDDTVVPFAHGKYLYEKLKEVNVKKSRVKIWEVAGCGHNDIEYKKGNEFQQELRRFFSEQVKGKVKPSYKDSIEEDAKMDCDESQIDNEYFNEMDKQMRLNSLSSTEKNTNKESDKVSIFESNISAASKNKKGGSGDKE